MNAILRCLWAVAVVTLVTTSPVPALEVDAGLPAYQKASGISGNLNSIGSVGAAASSGTAVGSAAGAAGAWVRPSGAPQAPSDKLAKMLHATVEIASRFGMCIVVSSDLCCRARRALVSLSTE